MAHLEIEDISRLAEGNVDKSEHDIFIKHIAQCEKCRKVYCTTLKFVEKERAKKKVPGLPGFQAVLSRILHYASNFFGNKRLRSAFAAVILILLLLIIPFFFDKGGLIDDQVQSIKERFLSPKSEYGFNGSPDERSSAIRTGIFIEDLAVVSNHAEKKALEKKIGERLIAQLNNISPGETDKLFPNPENIGEPEKVVKNIEKLIESHSLTGPFLFGRFLEMSFLDTFKDKSPQPEDIEKFQQIAQKLGLPQEEVLRALNKLKNATSKDDIKHICEEIEKIFFLLINKE
jgi:hypothetical protein